MNVYNTHTTQALPAFVLGFCASFLKLAHASSVAATIRCFTLPKLSNAGLTSKEKTGEPSGSGGAE